MANEPKTGHELSRETKAAGEDEAAAEAAPKPIAKVEIVVSSSEDPSAVAKMVEERLETLATKKQ